MATERLSIRRAKETLRLKWVIGQKHRAIGNALWISAGTVGGVVSRVNVSGLSWEIVETLSEEELEARRCGARTSVGRFGKSSGAPHEPP